MPGRLGDVFELLEAWGCRLIPIAVPVLELMAALIIVWIF